MKSQYKEPVFVLRVRITVRLQKGVSCRGPLNNGIEGYGDKNVSRKPGLLVRQLSRFLITDQYTNKRLHKFQNRVVRDH